MSHSLELEKKVEELTEKLIQKEKLSVLGELAGSIFHEIRNPLSIITNATYFLKITIVNADEKTKDYLEIISKETKKITAIIENILDISRIKNSQTITEEEEEEEEEEEDIQKILSCSLAEFSPPKNIEVSIKPEGKIPKIKINPYQIERSFSNIINNAYQAMPNGGELNITISVINDKIFVKFTDNGIGIPKENIDKVFEPLFTTKSKGIGLGLTVVKNLIEINRGEIKLESKEKGGQTTFLVSFPV